MTIHSTGLATRTVDEATFDARLAVLRQRFVERTRQDAQAIAALRRRWEGGEPLDGSLLKDMTRMMHGLAGAAGVFGFGAISDAAHEVETLLLSDAAGGPVDPGPLLDALEAEMALVLPPEPLS